MDLYSTIIPFFFLGRSLLILACKHIKVEDGDYCRCNSLKRSCLSESEYVLSWTMSISTNFKLGVLRNVAKGLLQDISALKFFREVSNLFRIQGKPWYLQHRFGPAHDRWLVHQFQPREHTHRNLRFGC